jgi:hypothetical protein
VAVDPYPFSQDELELVLSARQIPNVSYDSPDAVRAALEQARAVTLGCRLRPE